MPGGVKELYKPRGSYKTNVSYKDNGGDSDRWNINDPPMNCEFTGYFRGSGNDTVSAKMRGGRHTDSAPRDGCCYIPQFPTRGGPMEYQVECPHPNNHDCSATRDANCNALTNSRFTGYKVVFWNTAQNCVYWEAWQDKGSSSNSEPPTPANQWVRVSHHTDCTGNCGNIDDPLLRPKGSTSSASWRIDECGCNEDDGQLIFIVEIEQGVPAPGGGGTTPEPPETPGGGEIPEPEQPSSTTSKEWIDVWHVAQDSGESCTTTGLITPAEFEDLWDVSATTPATYFDLFAGSNLYCGLYVRESESRLHLTVPKEWTVTVFKQGTATGVLKLLEYDFQPLIDGTGSPILERQIGADISVDTLTSNVETNITIDDSGNNTTIKLKHAFVLHYNGGSATNKVRVRQTDIDVLDSNDTLMTYGVTPGAFQSPSRDMPWKIRGYKSAGIV